jgi:hypothetical protein
MILSVFNLLDQGCTNLSLIQAEIRSAKVAVLALRSKQSFLVVMTTGTM